ncbi:MAG: heme ABC transporter ATP-binding protein [Pseudomonadota bacterium]|nr:heme ABC transporter ATP-binding protein [Pseudomonadota bacterium]
MSLRSTELSYRHDGRALLDGVSLHVEAGQIHCIVGPNGAGKSTLLSLLSGERAAQCGHVSYNGQPLMRLTLAQRAQIRAVLPQRDLLTFAFTVDEVVRLGRMPARQHGARREAEIVEQAMHATDVWALRDHDYTSLSGGERSRVQLARVLCQIWEPAEHGTRILLLDEPTASLDIAHQHRSLQWIKGFAATGVAVIVILHDLNLAMTYADQVTLLDQGRAVASGTPMDVLTEQNLESVYRIQVEILRTAHIPHPIVVARA